MSTTLPLYIVYHVIELDEKFDIAANADMVLLDLVAGYLHGQRQVMQLDHLVMRISCACSFSVYIHGFKDLHLQCPHR